ncbi:MAG TPA: hypothetical protein VHS78_18135 [Candidatus Elarobacter sp.]|jgi:hypothetical protein|nr:hypothetical protein [Candidatus Elarobacter sp.]
MNRVSLADRVRIIAAVLEGNSVRGAARMIGVDKRPSCGSSGTQIAQ